MKTVGRPSGRPFSLALRFSGCESLRESPLPQAVYSLSRELRGVGHWYAVIVLMPWLVFLVDVTGNASTHHFSRPGPQPLRAIVRLFISCRRKPYFVSGEVWRPSAKHSELQQPAGI